MHCRKPIAISSAAMLFLALACQPPRHLYDSKDTFEYFGKRKPAITNPLFVLTDEVKKNIPIEKLSIFINAQHDIDLIASGQDPIFCTLSMIWLDGGTKTFSCSDYVITYWQEIRKINDVECTKKGISVKFNKAFLGMNRPFDDVSQTWIEFAPRQP